MRNTLTFALIWALFIGAADVCSFGQEDDEFGQENAPANPEDDPAFGGPGAGEMPVDMQAMMKQQLKQATEQQRVQMHSYMRIKIDDMQRVCGLSEEQVKKLEVAAKGAVGLAMEKWVKQMEQMQGQMFGQAQFFQAGVAVAADIAVPAIAEPQLAEPKPDEPKPDEPKPDEPKPDEPKLDEPKLDQPRPADQPQPEEPAAAQGEEPNADVLDVQNQVIAPAQLMPAMPVMGGFGMGVPGGTAAPANEPVWIKSVEKVLTPPQVQTYKKAMAERTAFRRKATLQELISSLDEDLLLTASQREQLTKLIDGTMGAQFESPRQESGMGPMVQYTNLFLPQVVQQVPVPKVKEILSKVQLERWEALRSGAMPGGMMGGGMFWNAVPALPAVRAVDVEVE